MHVSDKQVRQELDDGLAALGRQRRKRASDRPDMQLATGTPAG